MTAPEVKLCAKCRKHPVFGRWAKCRFCQLRAWSESSRKGWRARRRRQAATRAAAIIGLALLSLPTRGHAAACKTEAEARREHPKERLYWHTRAHCWDAVPVARARARTRANVKHETAQDDKPAEPPAEPPPAAAVAPVPHVEIMFPPVKPAGPPAAISGLLDPSWPSLLIDIDRADEPEPGSEPATLSERLGDTVIAWDEYNEIDAMADPPPAVVPPSAPKTASQLKLDVVLLGAGLAFAGWFTFGGYRIFRRRY